MHTKSVPTSASTTPTGAARLPATASERCGWPLAQNPQPASESAHYALMLAYRNAGRMEDAQLEKAVFEKLKRPPEGEFTEFLKKLGEKAPSQ